MPDDMGNGDENTRVCLLSSFIVCLCISVSALLSFFYTTAFVYQFTFTLFQPLKTLLTEDVLQSITWGANKSGIYVVYHSLLTVFYSFILLGLTKPQREGYTGYQVSTLWHILADGWVGPVSSFKGRWDCQLSTLCWCL
jgi:hypothetical protein